MVDKPKSWKRRERSGGDMCCLLIEARNTYPDDDYALLTALSDFLAPSYTTTLVPPFDRPGLFGSAAQKAAGVGLFGYLQDFLNVATEPAKFENVQRFLGTLIFEVEATLDYMYPCSGRGLARRYCVATNSPCDQYCQLIREYMYRLFTIRYFADLVRMFGHIYQVLFEPITHLIHYYTDLAAAPIDDAEFIAEMAISNCVSPAMARYDSDFIDTELIAFTAYVSCTPSGCLVWNHNAVRYPRYYLTYDVTAIAKALRIFYRLGQLIRYLLSVGRKDEARALACWAGHVSIEAGEAIWISVDDYMTSRNLWQYVGYPRELVEVVVTYTPLMALGAPTSYTEMSRYLADLANRCMECPWGELVDYRDVCGTEQPLPYSMTTEQCLEKYEDYFAKYGYARPNLPPIDPTAMRGIYRSLRRLGAPIIPPLPVTIAAYTT